ncbi:MAG: TolB family protein, partial [Candidatus Aminicenantales bacterium]
MKRSALVPIIWILFFAISLGAQTKPPATFSDYGPWESLVSTGAYGGFSPDGGWLVYGINRSNRENEIRVVKLADGTTKTVAFGAQPVFAGDSKWLACAVGMSEADQKKLKDDKKPVQSKLGLMNLGTGEMTTIDGIESFAFSPDGTSLAMKHYAPAGPSNAPASPDRGGRPGGPESADEAPGANLIVRRLATGLDATFGNVTQYAWQDGEKGRLLAMVLNVEGKTGNGVHLYDPEAGVLRVLESLPAIYTGLSWRKDAADLAVFRAATNDKKEGPTRVVLTWTGIGKTERRRIYDPMTDASFPAGLRTVDFRKFSWSASGDVLYFGIAAWDDKIAPPENKSKEVSTVEIWHAKDVYVMPWQKTNADTDRRRNMLAALHLSTGKLVPLGHDSINEEETPIPAAGSALIAEWSKYAFNRTIGRPAADIYLADVATGARTKIRENIDDSDVQVSPGGKFLLFLQNGQYWTVNTATRAIVN